MARRHQRERVGVVGDIHGVGRGRQRWGEEGEDLLAFDVCKPLSMPEPESCRYNCRQTTDSPAAFGRNDGSSFQ